MNHNKKGKLILISGPSASGKTTLRNKLLNEFDNIKFSVSYTTRSVRKGEINGKDYFFVSKAEFEKMIENDEFIEWANVYGNYYGTSRSYVNKLLSKGINVLLELDVQGGENVLKIYSNLCSIFVLPPSIEILKQRLQKRGTESEESFKKRFIHAKKEIEKKYKYRNWIVNDDIDEAYKILKSIIQHFLPAP